MTYEKEEGCRDNKVVMPFFLIDKKFLRILLSIKKPLRSGCALRRIWNSRKSDRRRRKRPRRL